MKIIIAFTTFVQDEDIVDTKSIAHILADGENKQDCKYRSFDHPTTTIWSYLEIVLTWIVFTHAGS